MSDSNQPEQAEIAQAIEAGSEKVGNVPIDPKGAFDFVIDVPLQISVEVGKASLLVREVLQLNVGSVVELDRGAGDPADVFVNGKLIARGEVSVVDGKLAVKISEVVGNVSGDASGSH